MTTGFDGLVAAVERNAWDEVRSRARDLSAGLAPTADVVVREILDRLDRAVGAPALIPLLAALGDLVDAHGWDAGAERIARQRLVVCEVRFAEAELGGTGPGDALRHELAEALVRVATHADPYGDTHRTAWFARALDVLAPVATDDGARHRAHVHAAAAARAAEAGADREALPHLQAAVRSLRPLSGPGDARRLQVALGALWGAVRGTCDGSEVLDELIRVGRLAAAPPDAELEALEALADHLFVRWEDAADPAFGAAFAEEILALRRRLALAEPSEASLEALQHALAGAAMAAAEAGQLEREHVLVAELRGS